VVRGSVPPCRLRRRKFWKFDYEMVHSEVLKNALVLHVFAFYFFVHFSRGGVSWPHLPLCAEVHDYNRAYFTRRSVFHSRDTASAFICIVPTGCFWAGNLARKCDIGDACKQTEWKRGKFAFTVAITRCGNAEFQRILFQTYVITPQNVL